MTGWTALRRGASRGYTEVIRGLVGLMLVVSGLGVLVMMATTCLDVVLRSCGRPLTGALDLVRLAGTISMACALPYTTAVKGHVAIEYFFHKLRRRNRMIVDAVCRVLSAGFFGVLAWQSVAYGQALRASGQVTQTMQIPLYWLPYVLALTCLTTAGVIIHHLIHPGKELMHP